MQKEIGIAECPTCGDTFVFNPEKVPTIESLDKPICKVCFLIWKSRHKDSDYKLDPDAYKSYNSLDTED